MMTDMYHDDDGNDGNDDNDSHHDDDYSEDGMLMMMNVDLLTGRARWDGVQGSLRVQVF